MKPTLLACLSLAAWSTTSLAQDATVGCTDSMVQGTYVATIRGSAPAPVIAPGKPGLPGAIQDFIGLVLIHFDGKGSFTQQDYIKGTLAPYVSARPGKGTYKVNPDCTGTTTITIPVAPFEIVTQFILTDNGAGFTFIVVTPSENMTTGTSRRIR